jgi:hypothetical protein
MGGAFWGMVHVVLHLVWRIGILRRWTFGYYHWLELLVASRISWGKNLLSREKQHSFLFGISYQSSAKSIWHQHPYCF